MGSANFTKNALIESNQYEELLVFDDELLYEAYLLRFDSLREKTLDYIPDRVRGMGNFFNYLPTQELVYGN